MVTIVVPEWFMCTILALMVVSSVLQGILAVLKAKIHRATKDLERSVKNIGLGD